MVRVQLLVEQSKKQNDDLQAIEDDSEYLQDHISELAEKYEDAKYRQERFVQR